VHLLIQQSCQYDKNLHAQGLQPVNKRLCVAWLQATLPLQDYVFRLAAIFAFFFALVGGPIAYQASKHQVAPA
jgi:hypothetical protein